MRGGKLDSFNDRRDNSAKAKQDLLERAKKLAPQNDPDFARRQAERAAAAKAREERDAAREAARKAEAERIAAEKAAAEAERIRVAEEERIAAEANKKAEEEAYMQLMAEQKAARDARYAARKARNKSRKQA